MFALSYAVQVNPPGATPVLNREQLWRGLVMKAENAIPFVQGMTKCELVDRGEDWILREITFAGSTHREHIILRPPVQVHFERVGEGGFIENTVSESELGLLLAFTFALQFPGAAAGSAEERAKGEGMRDAYVAAVGATLRRVRQMAADGEI
jgi:Domain of unknown function (DUF1857)